MIRSTTNVVRYDAGFTYFKLGTITSNKIFLTVVLIKTFLMKKNRLVLIIPDAISLSNLIIMGVIGLSTLKIFLVFNQLVYENIIFYVIGKLSCRLFKFNSVLNRYNLYNYL